MPNIRKVAIVAGLSEAYVSEVFEILSSEYSEEDIEKMLYKDHDKVFMLVEKASKLP